MATPEQPDPATFALPADAPAPDAGTRVEDVPPPPSGSAPGSSGRLDDLIAKLPIDPELVEQKPEILVGGAFAGAFIVAKLIRALGR